MIGTEQDHLMNTEEIKALTDSRTINTIGVRNLSIVRGEGTSVWDAEGRRYLDFFAGIAVANLGHCHPVVTEAICEQAKTLVHVSNLYYMEPQVRLASMLCEHCFADKWFFCNSGAEANEAAIKIARRYWWQKDTPKPGIITANNSFHGRTIATMTATGQPKYQEGFGPVVPGFTYVDYDDIDALAAAITPEVGAVMLEPIQGEGGVRIPSEGYFAGVREICDKKNILLILDEVQTGLGRTGKLFAHEHEGITPDIMTLAKALGNGVPIGAMGCTEEVSAGFTLGSHASTFGGNPLCTAAACATFSVLSEAGFIEGAAEVGEYFAGRLRDLQQKYESIVEVRARGLMIGVEMNKGIGPLIASMLKAGVVCGPSGPTVLRFVPALIVTTEEVDEVVAALDGALRQF